MNILTTGAKGFVGKNLVENLKAIRDGKNRTRSNLSIDNIYEYDIDSTVEELDEYCKSADFVFNLAGVNRPEKPEEFRAGNFGFASKLLDTLRAHNNTCPVMLSSSVQATLSGRFGESEYGKSKLAGEELFFSYAASTGATVFVYRFPNLFGKWCRPNYNSAVATFCNAVANALPYRVDNRETELELLYIDDLLEEMYDALENRPHRCEYPSDGETVDGVTYDGLTSRADEKGKYCYVPTTHKVTLGHIVDTLQIFKEQPETLIMPAIPEGSFEKKLYSTYLSYLPKEKMIFDLNPVIDFRGSFTEIMKITDHGQISVNVCKPGIVRGEHWHNSKWEQFIAVAGEALIQERKIGTDEIIEFKVSGDRLQVVQMLPGFTHNIRNIGDTDLVTVMFANEIFREERPETYREEVELSTSEGK